MLVKSLWILKYPRTFFRLLYYNYIVLYTMRFYHLFHFLGVALAAPSKGKGNSLSIFDNPTIPWNSSDSLPLPFLSHARRAGSTMTLNVSTCLVTVTVDPYWYREYTLPATLFITSPINSPGTKNGGNIFEMYLRVASPRGPGGLLFTTNQLMMNLDFDLKPPGLKNIDYVRTTITSTGAMVARVDYANVDHPEIYSPIRYNNEKRQQNTNSLRFDPPTEVIVGQDSGLSITVKDQGVVTGGFLGFPINGSSPYHGYYINGRCWNSLTQVVPISS
jgi:hypothetical protein